MTIIAHDNFNNIVSINNIGTLDELKNQIIDAMKNKYNIIYYKDNLKLVDEDGLNIKDMNNITDISKIKIIIIPISCKNH